MEFYTLNSNFGQEVLIEEFESGIWTERYTKPGDVKLVLPATRERVKQLVEGTFLSLKGSKEVMLIDTQLIEDNMLTITGNTLEKFLDSRIVRVFRVNPPAVLDIQAEWQVVSSELPTWELEKAKPAQVMAQIVQEMLISSYHLDMATGAVASGVFVQYTDSKINNLVLGPIYDAPSMVYPDPESNFFGFSTIAVSLNAGDPLHTALLTIAETHHLGISLYLGYANDQDYELRFTVYNGVNRTRSKGEFDSMFGIGEPEPDSLVRFSPEQDSFTNIKELRSNAESITRVLISLPNSLTAPGLGPISMSSSESAINSGLANNDFKRRVGAITTKKVTDKMIKKAIGAYVPGAPLPSTASGPVAKQEYLNGDLVEKAKIREIMKEEGRAYLAKHKRKKSLDGETVPQDYYRFGKDYNLGDIVEVEGYSGIIEKVRVTEYIRTQDGTGERAYPTLTPLALPDPSE